VNEMATGDWSTALPMKIGSSSFPGDFW